MFDYIDFEKQSQESALHAEVVAAENHKEVFCRFTGRKLGEIGLKPRGFDPEALPDFDAENEISAAIGEDTREAFRNLQLCGRGIVRSSSLIWDSEE